MPSDPPQRAGASAGADHDSDGDDAMDEDDGQSQTTYQAGEEDEDMSPWSLWDEESFAHAFGGSRERARAQVTQIPSAA